MRLLIVLLITFSTWAAAQSGPRSISLNDLRDRIRGGWAGQMIGVSYGAPTEFRYLGKTIPADKLPVWRPEKVDNALDQDDLYVDMTLAKVLDDKGLDATTDDFGRMFRDSKYHLWHANLAARRALQRGVPATLSGTPKYNIHANDIDFQIEADFIGLMTPGLPRAANSIAWRAGRVMNYGDGIYGGMFVGCMYAAAFFESDPRKVVEAGLACIPAQSPYGKLITDLLVWHKRYPNDWEKNWAELEKKWGTGDPCPEGALKSYNIDAKINGAYIALGLLYGGSDMGRTIEISTRAGQDSDCNPSSAAGILGTMLGWNKIPDHWKGGIPAIEDRKFAYTDFTFKTVVDSTYNRAVAAVKKAGGRVDGERLLVPRQTAVPAKLEVWNDFGTPSERVAMSDARWKLAGDWQPGKDKALRISATHGSTAEISFSGTGFIVVGQYLQNGGTADVFLDGKLAATVDVVTGEDRDKNNESIYHAFKLKPGTHTVKVLVRGEPYKGSTSAAISLRDLVVFR